MSWTCACGNVCLGDEEVEDAPDRCIKCDLARPGTPEAARDEQALRLAVLFWAGSKVLPEARLREAFRAGNRLEGRTTRASWRCVLAASREMFREEYRAVLEATGRPRQIYEKFRELFYGVDRLTNDWGVLVAAFDEWLKAAVDRK